MADFKWTLKSIKSRFSKREVQEQEPSRASAREGSAPLAKDDSAVRSAAPFWSSLAAQNAATPAAAPPAVALTPRAPPQAAAGKITPAARTPAVRSPVPVPAAPVPDTFDPLPKLPGSRRKQFRRPASWVARGAATQPEGLSRGDVDVYVGVDFGTSFTKAAVGLKDKIYAVSWEGVSGYFPDFLLPSEYSAAADGRVYLGQNPSVEAERVVADLKLPFISGSVPSAEGVERASTFLALVLRYIRAFVFKQHGSKIGAARIRWYLNIGAPCNGLERSDLVRAYELLAGSAWRRSFSTDVERVLPFEQRQGEKLQDLVSLEVKPEFVAQLAGYMQSPQRQRGLHALMDVGGGTLDLVTFNVHQRDGEDQFPFLVPEVRPLGTHGLLQNRLLAPAVTRNSIQLDELAPVPSCTEFAALVNAPPGQIHCRDELLQDAVKQLVTRVFETTRRRRYRLAEAWETGVRTFITGGGSAVSVYPSGLGSANVPSRKRLNVISLPVHPRLDDFIWADLEYQRISVACGLAQDPWTLGRVVPAVEVSDDRPVPGPNSHAERPDRDDLYPK